MLNETWQGHCAFVITILAAAYFFFKGGNESIAVAAALDGRLKNLHLHLLPFELSSTFAILHTPC